MKQSGQYCRTQTAKVTSISTQGSALTRIRKEVKTMLDESSQYIKFDEALIEMSPLMKSIEKCLINLIVSQLNYFRDHVAKYGAQ